MSEETDALLKKLLEKVEKLEAKDDEKENYKQDLLKTKEKLRKFESTDTTSELETLKSSLAAYEQEKKKLEQDKELTVKTYKQKLEEMTIQTHVKDAIAKNNGNPKFLEHHLMRRTTIVEDNGVQKVVVLDKNGNIVKNENGFATVEDLVNEFKQDQDFALAFKSNKTSGSGFTPNVLDGEGGYDAANNPFSKSSFNLTKQMELAKTNPALAKKLEAQANN